MEVRKLDLFLTLDLLASWQCAPYFLSLNVSSPSYGNNYAYHAMWEIQKKSAYLPQGWGK